MASLKDSVLLDTCRKLELISDTTCKKLKHILEMRNDIGISHPTNYAINAFELLGWLRTCVSEVLNDNPTEAALQVQAFIKNRARQPTRSTNRKFRASPAGSNSSQAIFAGVCCARFSACSQRVRIRA